MTLLQRYPEFLQKGAEFADIQTALEPERLALWQAEDGLCAQLCVDTATWGLHYWEEALGIPVDISKDTAFRRSRIRSKLRGVGVTTAALIRDTAASFSNGDVEVRELADQYRVEIKFVGTIGIPPNMDDLTASLREIMPAHLGWDYIILYNTHARLGRLTRGQLAAYTHNQLRNEVLSDGN